MGSDNGPLHKTWMRGRCFLSVAFHLFGFISLVRQVNRLVLVATKTSKVKPAHAMMLDKSKLNVRIAPSVIEPTSAQPKKLERQQLVPNEKRQSVRTKPKTARLPALTKSQDGLTFPATCTTSQLNTLKYQLPEFRCRKTFKRPWTHHCSFSYATRCPDPIWFNEQFLQKTTDGSLTAGVSSEGRVKDSKRTGILIGCDGVNVKTLNTIRLLTANPIFDQSTWRKVSGQMEDNDQCTVAQYSLENALPPQDTVAIYTIEPSASVAAELRKTAESLEWKDVLKVQTFEISNEDDAGGGSDQVPVQTLDQWVQEEGGVGETIQYLYLGLRCVVYNVLSGGAKVLQRIEYIEFEYNWKDGWADYSLSETVDLLKTNNFVCYWSGQHGNIWRITDCFLDYFDLKFWSNVACVNLAVAPTLASRMESMAEATLAKKNDIHFQNERFIGTTGDPSETV